MSKNVFESYFIYMFVPTFRLKRVLHTESNNETNIWVLHMPQAHPSIPDV